jgi:hypothetical protein
MWAMADVDGRDMARNFYSWVFGDKTVNVNSGRLIVLQ